VEERNAALFVSEGGHRKEEVSEEKVRARKRIQILTGDLYWGGKGTSQKGELLSRRSEVSTATSGCTREKASLILEERDRQQGSLWGGRKRHQTNQGGHVMTRTEREKDRITEPKDLSFHPRGHEKRRGWPRYRKGNGDVSGLGWKKKEWDQRRSTASEKPRSSRKKEKKNEVRDQ